MDFAVWVPIVVVAVLVVLLVLYLWVSYNALVTLRARVDEAWADITNQLQRRAELVPALSERIRAFATEDGPAFTSLDAARKESLTASDPAAASAAENHMQQALKSVFAVAQSYPQLLASQEFLQLQSEVVEAEDRIQSSRRFYNGGVREFNGKVRVFPNSLFARRDGFGQREFFEVGDLAAIAEPPRIQF